jgi:hypothetical protein
MNSLGSALVNAAINRAEHAAEPEGLIVDVFGI